MAMSPRLLRPLASGAFSPKKIAGLEAWYDASVASSVTLVSTFVSQWDDLSGNGLHLTQSVEANRPGTGTINGLTAVDFDGSNDRLERSGYTGTVGTVFSVHSLDVYQNGMVYEFLKASGGSVYGMSMLARALGAGASEYTVAGRNGAASSDSFNNGDQQIFNQQRLTTQTYDGTTSITTVDGTNLAGSTAVTLSNTATILLGARRQTSSYSLLLNGQIGEVVAYNRVLTASEIDKVESYLASKWGVTLA